MLKKWNQKQMVKRSILAVIGAVAGAQCVAHAQNLDGARTIHHKTCRIHVVSGLDYSKTYSAALPERYLSSLESVLASKGYEVTYSGRIGTYLDEPYYVRAASDQDAMLLIFRGVIGVMPDYVSDRKTEYMCTMSVDQRSYEPVYPSGSLPKAGYQSEWTTWIPIRLLCAGVSSAIEDSIPRCEKRE